MNGRRGVMWWAARSLCGIRSGGRPQCRYRSGAIRETTSRSLTRSAMMGRLVGGDSGLNEKAATIWTRETGMMFVSDYLTLRGVRDHLTWIVTLI